VASSHKAYVKPFAPEVPFPPIFDGGEELKDFLLSKRLPFSFMIEEK
jgi:hypothetical protein